ncbi:hypothetical protein KCTC32516_01389 [Polaribacter huanghezhanensis]|uniref:DUF1573 domain-containing protein n=1 Tax=Polaribacter huanghezhanensis TaxID=1354726 RepID=UPI002647EDE2|nr:DUF1573 domain-containing protein [Polaribacter huanghezhanensis]WKD86038.1 hypothetical protein KCTC32516_01389 [Polaribacter huanghezhanensis]
MKKIKLIFLLLIANSIFYSCDKVNEYFREAPVVEYSKMTYDFGSITMKDTINYTFKIKNISKNDLILEDVQSSCSCTVTNFTKKNVKLNEFAEIKVMYVPIEKGKVKQDIVLVANTKPRFTILNLIGSVN